MREEEAKALHASLDALVRAEGIYLRYSGHGAVSPDELGCYMPAALSLGGKPSIEVFRPRGQSIVESYEAELYTLAHEYGHALADSRSERPRVAMPTAVSTLPEAEKQLIEKEEERAWRYGRETLAALGITNFAGFDAARAVAAIAYKLRLWGP